MARPHVSLCIYDDKNLPDRITTILGLQPTESFEKGAFIRKEKFAERNFWTLSSQAEISDTADLATHIRWLIHLLRTKSNALLELESTGSESRIYIFWEISQFNEGFEIDSLTLQELGKLNMNVHFDIYKSE